MLFSGRSIFKCLSTVFCFDIHQQLCFHTALMSVNFYPLTKFWPQFFSTQKRVNRDNIDFATKHRELKQTCFCNKTPLMEQMVMMIMTIFSIFVVWRNIKKKKMKVLNHAYFQKFKTNLNSCYTLTYFSSSLLFAF